MRILSHADERSIDYIVVSDDQTFDQTFKSYYHPLCFYALKFVGQEDAEDIIEDVFLKLWDKKKVFNNPEHLRAWLYQAVHNACLDFLKVSKRAAERELNAFRSESNVDDPFSHRIIEAEVFGEIYRALNELPSQCRKIVHMSFIEGLSNREISEQLGLSEQTVKNQKGRGLLILRKKLNRNTFLLLLLLIYMK